MTEYLNKARLWIISNLTWILIVSSLLCFIISFKLNNAELSTLLEKIGIAMLSSGIFAAILKSLQFTGIFKEEILKVMTSTEFLENRNDLQDLWKRTTEVLYKKKFPEISDLLQQKILDNYLPTSAQVYYEDYNVSICIEGINENFEITYTQTCDYKAILENESKSVILEITSEISDDDDPNSKISNELIYFMIDNKNIDIEEDPSTINDNKKSLFKYELTGKKIFNIKSKYRRTYPLKNENYKLFRMKYLTHGMHVSIDFPEDVRVSFFSVGLTNGFSGANEDFKNHICKILRNDLILPHQGFGLSFEKK